MSIIKITNFGGLAPSLSARSLGSDMAQTNQNLYAPIPEFRPLAADRDLSINTTVTNPVTIYKVNRRATNGAFTTETQGWRASSALVNYVKGQIDDDQTERTYYSYNDGSTAPRAFCTTGTNDVYTDKPLGVTPPSTAPTVTLVRGDKYTIEEDSAARAQIPAQVKTYILAASTQTMFGDAPTPALVAGNADGWAAHSVTLTGGNPATQLGEYSYCVLMTNGTAGFVVPATHNWALAPELKGKQVTYGGFTYWAVPITVQGVGWTVNSGTLTTSFKEILNPDPDFVRDTNLGLYTGTQPTKQLFPDTNCASVATFVSTTYAVTSDPQESHIRDIATRTAGVLSAVGNYNSATPQIAAVKAFYSANQTVTDHLLVSINQFADEMVVWFRSALTIYGDPTTTPETNLRADIMALFPATFTVAAVGSNTYINFTGTNGALEINLKNLRSAVLGALAVRIPQAVSLTTSGEADVKAQIIGNYDRTTGPTLERQVSFSTISSKFPNNLPVVTPVAERQRAVVDAISYLRGACDLVTEDYNRHTRELISLIDRLFDEQIAPLLSKPRATSLETRAYVTTWVTTWGEESAPSAPSALVEDVDDVDSVTVTKPSNVVASELQAGWRLYRTNTGSNSTDYQLVVGRSTDTGALFDSDGNFLYFNTTLGSYSDNQPGFMLGETIPSSNWLKPDSRLKGLVAMANGMMAGFYDNVVCFCESYKPYAWPVDYQLTTKYPIVGIESAGANLFVLTRGSPYLMTGNDPASVSPVEVPSNQSCSSQRSIVAIEGGALYASPDGLCLFTTGGVEVITLGLFSREDWQKLTPSSIIGAYHEGVYYFTYTGNGGGSYALDLRSKKMVSSNISGSSIFVDKSTDTMYMASGTTINAVFGHATNKRTGVYKTGVITLPSQQPLAWLKVFSDFSSSVTVKWYGDGTLRHTATVSSIEPVRLPAGRYLEHEVEITTSARVTGVFLTSTTEELKGV